MLLGEFLKLTEHLSPQTPLYGVTNFDGFDPGNRFNIVAVKLHLVDCGHYVEPCLVIESDVL